MRKKTKYVNCMTHLKHDQTTDWVPHGPPMATTARPGTKAKVEELAKRALLGLELHADDDVDVLPRIMDHVARDDDGVVNVAEINARVKRERESYDY